jgi:Uma2 family endonuclease
MTLTTAKWTIDEYQRLVATGILAGRRVELLQGDIVEMAPEGPATERSATSAANDYYMSSKLPALVLRRTV